MTVDTLPICYCGALMTLRTNRKLFYPDGTPRKFYGCTRPACDGRAHLHSDGTLMSTACDAETRLWRHKAHQAFDAAWMSRLMGRVDAYLKLARVMGLTPDHAHIGFFNIDQCKTVIENFSGIDKAEFKRQKRQSKHGLRRSRDFRRRKMNQRQPDGELE